MTGRVLFRSAEGPTLVRLVGRGERPVLSLVVGGVVQGDDSRRGAVVEARHGLLPALLGGGAEEVLVVGLGTGIALSALLAALPGARRLVALERCSAVPRAAEFFRHRWAAPIDHPPVEIVIADGRDFLARTRRRFDLIACDLIDPADSPHLYTVEFHRLCAARLRPGGLFTQWVPLFQTPLRLLQRVVSGFAGVFGRGSMWVAGFDSFKPTLLLVGRTAGGGGMLHDEDRIKRALSAVPAAGISRPGDVRRLRLGTISSARRLAEDAPPLRRSDTISLGSSPTDLAATIPHLLRVLGGRNPTLRTFLEALLAEMRGEFRSALVGYRRLWVDWPDDPLLQLTAAEASCSLLVEEGLTRWSAGDLTGAEETLRRATSIAPDRAEAWGVLAQLLTTIGCDREALEAINTALAIDPDNPRFRRDRTLITHNLRRRGAK